uniref:NADH-ubiquinone oxidoreductase chain 3 n=1 Tax=Ornithodoros zumpti TaxID=1827026 RepID=A0A1P8AGF3_9ACAR|nr:NADH dehydrogenase subunit 3 [Ornithodoros zumpti]AMX74176.1 NADH dehydrogenase subunit 3 [Ornithodoros zumpti]AMX74189.1 NADH dehydrogenase subunit 3 [Ornithodoros zumpti]UYB78775.1 NADH dehydrogenase subunit 3 [Ornithodoros zumpti]
MKYMIISCIFPLFLFLTAYMIKFTKSFQKEKNTPFECGFDPFSISRLPFSLRFFMISITFLIFDIEIIIILPIPILSNLSNLFLCLPILIIISLIFFGLIYEWVNGMIEWLN